MARYREFADALTKWDAETKFESSATKLYSHPSYRELVAMGPDVIPWILGELGEGQYLLGYALTEITGETPGDCPEGDVKAQAEAWLLWGQENGFI